MYLQKCAVLIIVSQKNDYKTTEIYFKKQLNAKDIETELKRVINIYDARGLEVKQINGDGEFETCTNETYFHGHCRER